jgi:hypothetical protein
VRVLWRLFGSALGVLAVFVAVQTAKGESAPSSTVPPPSGVTRVDPRLVGVQGPNAAAAIAGSAVFGFTANARVNQNAGSLSRPQVEPSVTSKPSDRSTMVAGFADYVADVIPGVARSTDGGKTWVGPTGGALLPDPPSLIWGDRASVGHIAGGDSAVAWGTGNTVFFSTLGFQDNRSPPTPGACNVGGVYVYRSTDGGNTWTLPAGGPAVANTQTVFRDKEYIAVDTYPTSPRVGTVYMTWDDDVYSGCPQDFGTNFVSRRIMFSRSTDGGVTWSTPTALASGCLVASIPAVGADGSVYVTWFDCNSGDGERVRKSADGIAFAPAVSAASGLTRCPNPLPGASFRDSSAAFPTIATDPTAASRVYVAWSSCTATAQADVFLSRSVDGGATWSPTPLRVNDDGPSNPRDQFFPSITVDDAGVVRAMWGDDRLDTVNPGGHNYDIFNANSTDHGASFGTNVRVTSQSSNPDADFGGTFIGDYFGIAPCGTPIWTDTRNGSEDAFAASPDANGDGTVDSCTPGDTTPPIVKKKPAPAFTSSVNLSSIPVKIAWSATDPSGVCDYSLQESVNGAAYTAVTLPTPTATSITRTQTPGNGYQYRVAATDCVGNASDFVAGSAYLLAADDQNSGRFTYLGVWTTTADAQAWGGSTAFSTDAGAKATYGANAGRIAWIAAKGPDRGQADVYVDGVFVRTVDLFAKKLSRRRLIYQTAWKTVGAHTLAVVNRGTAGRPLVEVDVAIRTS